MRDLTRREFLGASGVLTIGALGALAGCSSGGDDASSSTTARTRSTLHTSRTKLPAPDDAPFDTVVVLMMENRSFDHLLGWLPGANGKQAGLSYVDTDGKSHHTWKIAPDWQGCDLADPGHDWESCKTQLNGGKVDGFLQTAPVGDQFPISYYTDHDLPNLAAMAQGYTTLDNYFCSVLGPTWPNRLYQWSATTDLKATGLFPTGDAPRPSHLETTIFDRVREAGLTGGYYYHSEPMSGLFASKKYDDISYPIDKFWDDATKGKLPNVTFVDPEYGTIPELTGTSNDFHPRGSVRVGDSFLAQMHDAVTSSPQFERTVFVVNFDEHGGFYDHVVPPRAKDDTKLEGPGPDLTQLGFRVPAMVISPFAPKKIDSSGPYEHTSILKMIEWRWGLEPMTKRDANANNLAEALDFNLKRDAVKLPAVARVAPVACPT